MGLLKSIDTVYGIRIENAYIKIVSIIGNKERLSLTVCGFSNKEAESNNLQPVIVKEYSFVPSVNEDSQNFIKQGYEYLKTLPEYTDAVDC